ncbi:MAG: translation initiation factor IF-2 subunit beta [archaeon]
MTDYETLLKRAGKTLPKNVIEEKRFEIPKVRGHVEGIRTILTNFFQIASDLSRDPQHLLKYLQHELATPTKIDGPRLILGRKLSSVFINSKIEQYAHEFVICPKCGKPDTEIIEGGKTLKCTACGEKSPIKSKI